MQELIKTRHIDDNTGQWENSYITIEGIARIIELRIPGIFVYLYDGWRAVTQDSMVIQDGNISLIAHYIPCEVRTMTLLEFRDLINTRIEEGMGDFEVVQGNVNFLVPWMGAMGTTPVMKIPHPAANIQAYRVPINSNDNPEAERVIVVVL